MDEAMVIGLEIHLQLHTETKLFCGCPASSQSKPWVKAYLEAKKAEFAFVEHEPVYRPVDSARARGVEVSQIAKALVYLHNDKPVLFILPGDRKLSNEKAAIFLGGPELRMATTEEVFRFTGCVAGLVPPVKEGIRKVVDEKLLENKEISFNAGTGSAGIIMGKGALLSVLDNYEVADISAEETIKEKPAGSLPEKAAEEVSAPNTRVCGTCLGLPGSKPRLNRKALDYALKVALALNCRINREFFFSRKTYFYPDLAKDFQITQYEVPVGKDGSAHTTSGKKAGITRVHLEEDPASLIHSSGIGESSYTLVDYIPISQ
jgi:prolyl-tRNA editing enzyme YbaK/EbsC (Cys-tRNA(Pro) deacylase)